MTGFNHVLTGVTIAVVVKQPLLAPILSLISHFILDSLPHFGNHPDIVPYNRKFKMYLVVEVVLILAVIMVSLALFPNLWWLIIACASLAFLPDFFWILESRLRPRLRFAETFYQFHTSIQKSEYPQGWIIELIYFGILLVLLSQYI